MYYILLTESFVLNSLFDEMKDCKFDILNVIVCFRMYEVIVNKIE